MYYFFAFHQCCTINMYVCDIFDSCLITHELTSKGVFFLHIYK